MKSQIKSILGYGASKLPWGGQRAVLEAIIATMGAAEVFSLLAQRLGVTSALAHGESGSFHGAPDDVWVFGRFMETRRWAPATVNLFTTLFATGRGTYLDIGAHIGLTLVPIAACEGVTCHAFEPEPRNLAFLRENIVENGIAEKATAWPVALSDAPGRVRFALSPFTSGNHCIWSAGEGARGEESWPVIEVEAARLDDLLTPAIITPPLGVKIDAEGAEPRVFSGGANILAGAAMIVTEFFPYMMRRLGDDVAAEIDFLRAHFREGSIMAGETDDRPQWRPIAEIAAELDRIWVDPDPGLAYFDVAVRK